METITIRNRSDATSFIDRLKRSWELVKESFRILMLDKELLLFPLISGVFLIFVVITYVLPLFFGQIIFAKVQARSPIYYIWTFFTLYLLSYFVIIFFNVALISCVSLRLKGSNPVLKDGFKSAFRNLHKIAVWAVVSATVGVIINTIENKSEWLGKLLASIAGIVWSLATFFVVPVMIFENRNIFGSLRRSAELFKKTWGETIAGEIGMGAFFGFLSMICILGFISSIFITFFANGAVFLFVPLALLFAAVLFVVIPMVSSALNGIYLTALYIYATTRKVPKGFSQEFVKNAYAKKV